MRLAALLWLAATATGLHIEPAVTALAIDAASDRALQCNATHETCRAGRTCVLRDAACATPALAECYGCLHKRLFPVADVDGYGTVALFVAGVLAGAAGIGGGGLNVPLLMLIQGFYIYEAVPISHVLVFGNSVAQNLVNLQRRHPKDQRRPLVDFDVPLLLLPAQLGGNAVGVILSPVLPSTLLVLLSCAVLVLATSKTLHRGLKDFGQERRANSQAREAGSAPGEALASSSTHSREGGDGAAGECVRGALLNGAALLSDDHEGCDASRAHGGRNLGATCGVTNRPSAAAFPALSSAFPAVWGRASPAAATARRRPRLWWQATLPSARGGGVALKVGSLVLFWTCFIADYFGVRATHAHDKCSARYLAWQLALLIAVAVASAAGAHFARQAPANRVVMAGDIEWTRRAVCVSVGLAFCIGVVAGLVGLGGGELMAPLLFSLGMLPQVCRFEEGITLNP